MDEAADISQGEELDFCISGGEPFLDFDLLLDIVGHGSSLGGVVTCQTNGYWASNDEQARSRLLALKNAGLDVLGVSVSQFHDVYVRRSRVQRALTIARELGLATVIKCATTGDGDTKALRNWTRACGADRVEEFPLHPYLRNGVRLPQRNYQTMSGLPQGRCPAALLTIRENGRAYTCCMPGAFNEFLTLGSADEEPLADLHDRFVTHGRQQLLRQFGPTHFANAAISQGHGGLLRAAYADVCDMCSHITTVPEIAAIADEMAVAWEIDQLQEVFRELMDQVS